MAVFEIASSRKIAIHKERVKAFLAGKEIFPVTLELDITSRCNRACLDCPSSRASRFSSLGIEFIENLFARLEHQTGGLLLTGGEATLYPDFVKVLELARKHGFREIAVVTNGSQLGKDSVIDGFLLYASTVRISFYDWTDGPCAESQQTLRRIEVLRKRIEHERSPLQIGVSVLTSKAIHSVLPSLGESVKSAGAHWVYFHPMCTEWGKGRPTRTSQNGVIERIAEFQRSCLDGFHAYFSKERYTETALHFNGYHAAHFLMVVGADGRNYLAPEVKYQPGHVIANFQDLDGGLPLWRERRLKKISSVRSATYAAIQSRHRGVLYSDYIERIKDGMIPFDDEDCQEGNQAYRFPFIL